MLSPKSELFVKEVLSYIKFVFDRKDIRKELEAHISDKMDYYSEQGYEAEEAEQLSLKDMGDAKEIGTELNQQHNPILGWLWRITNSIALMLFTLFCLVILITIGSYFRGDLIKEVVNSDIVYQIDIDKQVRIDDMVIRFTKVILEENGDLNIFYRCYNENPWRIGTFRFLGDVMDDKGTVYIGLSGIARGGIITKGVWGISGFSKEADTLIISYDRYNRKYRLEIPLEAGGAYE